MTPHGNRRQDGVLLAEASDTGEQRMARESGDRERRTQRETDYAGQSDSGAKPGFALSAWSLVFGAVFLLLVLGGLLII